ncbi:MAG: Rrf2 family transcriptional regulator [Patescibacteria group bacterium]
MLKISKQSDYALIIISQLYHTDAYTPLSVLISKTKLPKRFLARIAADLVNRKILLSREGRVGGYKLAPSISSTTLYEFFSIFEKNLNFVRCMEHSYICKFKSICKHKDGVRTKLNNIVINQLKKIKLAELFLN